MAMDQAVLAGNSKYRKYYPVILGLTLAIVIFLAVYVNVILGIEVVYTHLFYIPIILAGIFYHRKAVYVALALGVLHIFLSFAADGMMPYESFLRAIIFVATAYLVGTISARKDLLYDRLRASEDSLRRMRDTLELQVRERTRQLSSVNESLQNEIAERNRAEKSLMLARFSIDRAADFIAWIKSDGSLNYVNDALCRATGYTRDEMLVMKAWDIEPETLKEKWPEIWQSLKESGSCHAESTLRTRDGRLIPVAIMNNYLQFRGEEYNCAYIRDITKRKLAENALKKSRTILARAQKIAHVGNLAWDLKTDGMQWSDEVYRIFGYEPGALLPTKDMVLSSVFAEDHELVSRAFDAAVRENRLFDIDFRIVARDGSLRYVNCVADRLARDPAGNPAWIYGIIQDITKRKLAETELQDAKAQAELYLDLMSHDINNMNQIGIGYLELVLSRGDLSDETRALLNKPLEALESSSRLIRNVTSLQRAREGGFCAARMNVRGVIGDVLPRYAGVSGRDIRFEFNGCDCFVMANDLLFDVFSNIIGNAIKHSSGPLAININVERVLEDGKAYCLISVADNGPGIPDRIKGQLFVRFQRGATQATGRGLGLYLVKTLVDDYHGTVWAEDRVPGDHTQGAKFVIMLPAVE
ncbi:MAG: putative diguanylate cyclase [Methanocella sp. PtaU1.Bin125]|nr:MAG: putative diguanylate cyclase [Methanocella sp. PtaU1.Bin125]